MASRPAGQTEERVCPKHGLTIFHRYRVGATGHRWRCKRCVGEAVTRRHQRVKAILVEEAGGCCALCGYDRCVRSLHFHHLDPSTKSFGINLGHGRSLTAYRAEATKCVLVCANCHGEIESGLVAAPTRSPAERPSNRTVGSGAVPLFRTRNVRENDRQRPST